MLKPPEICPVCGEDVPQRALACPECGADHHSGWRLDADFRDALGDTDAPFDYEDFVRKEFGAGARWGGSGWIWWATALFLLAALVVLSLMAR